MFYIKSFTFFSAKYFYNYILARRLLQEKYHNKTVFILCFMAVPVEFQLRNNDYWNRLFHPHQTFMEDYKSCFMRLGRHAQPLKRARDVALCLKLLLVPFIVWANSESSSETAHMHRLTWAFTVRLCDKYPYLMNWLIRIFNGCLVKLKILSPWLTVRHRTASSGVMLNSYPKWRNFQSKPTTCYRFFFLHTAFLWRSFNLKLCKIL